MDDGYRQQFRAQADRICFATNGFQPADVARLGCHLEARYGISYHIGRTTRDMGATLVINSGRQQIRRPVEISKATFPHGRSGFALATSLGNDLARGALVVGE
jgi:hypothetical protein